MGTLATDDRDKEMKVYLGIYGSSEFCMVDCHEDVMRHTKLCCVSKGRAILICSRLLVIITIYIGVCRMIISSMHLSHPQHHPPL